MLVSKHYTVQVYANQCTLAIPNLVNQNETLLNINLLK